MFHHLVIRDETDGHCRPYAQYNLRDFIIKS